MFLFLKKNMYIYTFTYDAQCIQYIVYIHTFVRTRSL